MAKKKIINVLFIHHGTILGGAPISLMLQVKHIANRGNIKPKIVCHSKQMQSYFSDTIKVETDNWPDPLPNIGKLAIGMVNSSPQTFFLLFKSFLQLPFSIILQTLKLFKEEANIVHLNSSVLFTSAIAAWLSRKKIIWHVREASISSRAIGKFIRWSSDRTICISPIEQKKLRGVNDPKLKVVYNPIDFTTLDPSIYQQHLEKRKLGIPSSSKMVLSLGGVVPRKGALEIISAMENCRSKPYLVFAGPKPNNRTDKYNQKIMHTLRKLSKEQIQFTGIVKNVAPLLSACDILVFAGTTPHFPRPVYEAWAMKKPVIVFKMDGISNNVDDGIDGIIVNDISSIQLGEAIDTLLQSPETMKAMGESGYQKAFQRVHAEISSKKVEDVILEISK